MNALDKVRPKEHDEHEDDNKDENQAQRALQERARTEDIKADKGDSNFLTRAVNKVYAPVMKLLKRIVRSVTPEQTVRLVLWFSAVYSICLSYMPRRLLHAICGNGLVEELQRRPEFRKIADKLYDFMNKYMIIKIAFGVSMAVLTVVMLPLVIAYSILSDPRAVRSFLSVMFLPNAFGAFFWYAIMPFVPRSLRLSEATIMASCAAFSGLCVGGLYVFCSRSAPKFLRWMLGILTPGMFVTAVGAGLVFGTITAIIHLEGHRNSDGTTGSVKTQPVHSVSVVLAGMAAVGMLLVMPYVDQRAFARIRALSPI